MVKVTPMKRTYTLIVLFGLVIGTMLTGCSKSTEADTAPATDATNAPAATN